MMVTTVSMMVMNMTEMLLSVEYGMLSTPSEMIQSVSGSDRLSAANAEPRNPESVIAISLPQASSVLSS